MSHRLSPSVVAHVRHCPSALTSQVAGSRKGVSRSAIKGALKDVSVARVNLALKKGVESKKLIKTGDSYKLAPVAAKPKVSHYTTPALTAPSPVFPRSRRTRLAILSDLLNVCWNSHLLVAVCGVWAVVMVVHFAHCVARLLAHHR